MVKNAAASAGYARDVGSIPGLGRSPGGRHGNPLQYSCLEWTKELSGPQPIGSQSWTRLKQLSIAQKIIIQVCNKKESHILVHISFLKIGVLNHV